MSAQTTLLELFPNLDMAECETRPVRLDEISDTYARANPELRSSLESRGLLQPVLLNRVAPGKYSIADGRRRIDAARSLGWETIQATIVQTDSVVEAALAITANAVRGDNPLSDILAITELAEAGYSTAQIAAATGLRVGTIRKRMKLRNLPQELWQGVMDGDIAIGIGERVASAPESVQASLVDVLAERGRITGADLREASSAVRDDALAGLAHLFDMPEAEEPEEDDPLDAIHNELVTILKPYVGRVTRADLVRVTTDAWREARGVEESRGAAGGEE